MAFFGVTIEEIGSVAPIPGADRIEVATLRGKDFQFVIARGSFTPGAPCLYFPVDSLLPSALAETLGVAGKLAGKDKNRVKTVKLRGQISQGIVSPTSLVPADLLGQGPEALTAHFGVTKYDPPEIVCNDATLVELPDGVSVYDIEGADRYTLQAALLFEGDVMITEKVEGSNFSVLVRPDGELMVNQRTKTIVPREGATHTFWKIAQEHRVLDFARALAQQNPGKSVLVYGEALGPGIQGNLYQLKNHEVRFFDIRIGGSWLAPQTFLDAITSFYGRTEGMVAPVLHQGPLADWLAGKSIKEASNGTSKLANVLREGVVIRPAEERIVPEFGRLVLKQRSPEYLAKSERLESLSPRPPPHLRGRGGGRSRSGKRLVSRISHPLLLPLPTEMGRGPGGEVPDRPDLLEPQPQGLVLQHRRDGLGAAVSVRRLLALGDTRQHRQRHRPQAQVSAVPCVSTRFASQRRAFLGVPLLPAQIRQPIGASAQDERRRVAHGKSLIKRLGLLVSRRALAVQTVGFLITPASLKAAAHQLISHALQQLFRAIEQRSDERRVTAAHQVGIDEQQFDLRLGRSGMQVRAHIFKVNERPRGLIAPHRAARVGQRKPDPRRPRLAQRRTIPEPHQIFTDRHR